ncbi:hypothetical protein GCM10027442_21430 [Emticicia fontis]
MNQEIKNKVETNGFAVVNEVFNSNEVAVLLQTIRNIETSICCPTTFSNSER